jgi:AcrR family transcriptional regulator
LKTKRQVLKARTKQRILQVASTLFLEKDFDVITTDIIAQQAGVSKGTIFHHFETKEQLGIEVIENLLRQNLQILLPTLNLPPKERLRKFVKGGVFLASKTPGLSKLLIQIMSRVEEDDANRIFTEGCVPYFQEGTNIFSELNILNPAIKAQLLVAIFDGLGLQFYLENIEPDDKLLEELTDEIMGLFFNEK